MYSIIFRVEFGIWVERATNITSQILLPRQSFTNDLFSKECWVYLDIISNSIMTTMGKQYADSTVFLESSFLLLAECLKMLPGKVCYHRFTL